MDIERYDAIVIGFGKGGKTLAGKLAETGSRVAMIERSDQMYGGTCINVGCIPSKSLIRSASIARMHTRLLFEARAAMYGQAVGEKRRLTQMLRKKNFDKLNDDPNVTVYNGRARFLSQTRVEVTLADRTVSLEGEKIFINTGASPVIPPIEGIKENPYIYYSETLMDLEKLPEKLVIIGGGYIGLEFASMYSGFGSQVTVLQDGGKLIPREDRDVADKIQEILEENGVTFKLGASIHRVEAGQERARVLVTWNGREEELLADAVLVATGRKPNTGDLNAEAAGVSLTPRGAVETDELLKSTAPNIWAMGDVRGDLQFTYTSLDDYRVVWSQLNGGDYTVEKRKNVPYSVFLSPAYSRVGMSEEEALRAGRRIKVAKLPAAAIPKAQVLKEPRGYLKAVIDADTDKILGAMLICEESYEMINTVKLAMDLEADYRVLRDQIFTHPTMSEALNDLFNV